MGAFHQIENSERVGQLWPKLLGSFMQASIHKDLHVVAVIDQLGKLVETRSWPTNSTGYENMWEWMGRLGAIAVLGVEGTGSYGAGVTRYLQDHGAVIKEDNRPNRQNETPARENGCRRR